MYCLASFPVVFSICANPAGFCSYQNYNPKPSHKLNPWLQHDQLMSYASFPTFANPCNMSMRYWCSLDHLHLYIFRHFWTFVWDKIDSGKWNVTLVVFFSFKYSCARAVLTYALRTKKTTAIDPPNKTNDNSNTIVCLFKN